MTRIPTLILVLTLVSSVIVGQQLGQTSTTPSPQVMSGQMLPTPSPTETVKVDTVKWTEKVQAYSAVFTFFITLFGFLFVYFQVRNAKRYLNGFTHATVYTQQHTINQLFLDHPDLRKYFYENVECSIANTDRPEVLPLAEMIADFFEHLAQQQANLPHGIWPAWVRYMRHVYENSPILREHFENNNSWYDENFIEFIDPRSNT